MALSDSWLKAHVGKTMDKRIEKSDSHGLSVRVTTKGKVIFQLRYRFDGKPVRLDLGSYPTISLKQARQEAFRLKGFLEEGRDPKIAKQLEKQELSSAITVQELFHSWYESYCLVNKTMHKEIKRSFELYVFPELGALPANDVSIHIWLKLLEDKVKSSPSIADRILVNAKQMLSWGVRRELINKNPIAQLTAKKDLQIKTVTNDRSFSDDEIRLFLEAIHHSRMARKNKIFLKLCLIYGCRNGELRRCKKEHFNFTDGIWTVPPENHKVGKITKKPLLRPITPEIKALLEEVFSFNKNSEYVFLNANGDTMMGRSATLSLPYNISQWIRKNKKIELEHWSVHDLRKTARTNFSQLTEPHVAEIMLGHKLAGQWQVYDLYDYIKEQKEALLKWCEKLSSLDKI
ncbi:site-specific integrase [Aliivibrio fischeri]